MNYQNILGPKGLLAEEIPGFIPRQSQINMAAEVTAALKDKQKLVIEAATGTGKTFAYLIPALLSGKKVIVSTGTKNLQDQLFHKDLPLLRKLLKRPIKVALLKGRSNYICTHRLEKYNKDGRFQSREIVSNLYKVKLWAKQTQFGDVAELTMIPEDSQVWPYVTSNKENCLGQDCQYFSKCHLLKARQYALKADLLVINHHLFFADLALKDSGFGELLPGVDAVIFDEAHQIPEIASQFFGQRMSSRQLLDLARDVEIEMINSSADIKEIPATAMELDSAVKEMRLAFGMDKQRQPWAKIVNKPELQRVIRILSELLVTLTAQLKQLIDRSKGLENLWQRSYELLNQFKCLTGPTPEQQIHWFEVFSKSFSINLTPLSIAKQFLDYLEQDKKAWIFTSATLSVANNFDFFAQRMGLAQAKQIQCPPIFDYENQTKLYIPKDMPEPNAMNYVDAVVEASIPVINACQGRTFFLFTSHQAIKRAYQIIQHKISYPILVQGSQPKNQLLQSYRELGHAVLLGTASFWEGVDVKGEALSCVIIDKLPFAAIGDPILQARTKAIREQGGEPFFDYQIPQAIIQLKQGVGRLIRDVHDRGIIMLCDPRLLSKPYGKLFLQSLPPMPLTRDVGEVVEFYKVIERL